MDFFENTFITYALTAFALVILTTLLIDYMRSEGGLRKGSVLLCIMSISMIALPIAKNLRFKTPGVEFSIETAEKIAIAKDDLDVQALKIANLSTRLGEQSADLKNVKFQLMEEIESNRQLLNEFASQVNGSIKTDIEKLITKSEEQFSELSAEPTDWEIGFESIKFDHICEKLNSKGEFYFSFLVNGEAIVDLDLDQRISARKGDIYSLRKYPKTKLSFLPNQNEKVSISGFVKEYDGRTVLGLGRSIKVNPVGFIQEEISLPEQSFDLHIPDEANSKCKVTLSLTADKLN